MQSMGYSQQNHDNLDSLITVAAEGEIFICDRHLSHFCVFDVLSETWRRVDIPEEAWYYGEHSVSIFVDGVLLHLLRHRSGSTPHNDHMAYDTVNDSWIGIDGGLPRHTVSSESDRILSVVNYDGPNDYIFDTPRQSRGGVHAFERRGEHDCMITGAVDLPVRYDAVERAIYVAMP